MKANGKWYYCPVCKEQFYRTPGQLTKSKVLYCSRKCFQKVNSKRMTEMNKELNPTRMTIETRTKIRTARKKIEKGRVKSPLNYNKYYSRLEHRVVMESMIGRPLLQEEVVHHINHNRRDNRPENLMLFSSRSEHQAFHKAEAKQKGGGANEIQAP